MGYQALNSILGGLGVVMALGGCHYENPLFQDTDDPGTTTATTNSSTGPGVTSMDSADSQGSADSVNTTIPPVTSGSSSGPTSTSPPTDGSTTITDTDASSSGQSEICPSQEDNSIDLIAFNPLGMEYDCNGALDPIPDGYLELVGDEIHVTQCLMCDPACAGDLHRIFVGDLPVPPLDECGTVYLWTNGEVPCTWTGMAIILEGDLRPMFIAANTRYVPPPAGGFEMLIAPRTECSEGKICKGDPAGDYALDLAPEDIEVGMGAVRDLPIVGEAPYFVFNRMSFIDTECNDNIAWTAELQPG